MSVESCRCTETEVCSARGVQRYAHMDVYMDVHMGAHMDAHTWICTWICT